MAEKRQPFIPQDKQGCPTAGVHGRNILRDSASKKKNWMNWAALNKLKRRLERGLQIQVSIVPRRCCAALWFLASLCLVDPDTWDGKFALWASPIYEAVFHHIVPRAPHEQLLALRAIGVCAVAIDISLVDMVQANFHGNLSCAI